MFSLVVSKGGPWPIKIELLVFVTFYLIGLAVRINWPFDPDCSRSNLYSYWLEIDCIRMFLKKHFIIIDALCFLSFVWFCMQLDVNCISLTTICNLSNMERKQRIFFYFCENYFILQWYFPLVFLCNGLSLRFILCESSFVKLFSKLSLFVFHLINIDRMWSKFFFMKVWHDSCRLMMKSA